MGETTLDTTLFFMGFIKIPNYSSRDMAIHNDADLSKALQTLSIEPLFQVGYCQLKAIRELKNIFDAENKTPNRYTLPTPLASLTKKRSKIPSMEDQIPPPPRVDPDE